MSPMFSRPPRRPDLAVLAQVNDGTEVDLGTYPEEVLAVVGAYPVRNGVDHKPNAISPFTALESQDRMAAMRSALDQLIAEGTLNLPPGAELEKVVAAGLDGKLAVNGQLAPLYDLACWLRRHGYRARLGVGLAENGGPNDAAPGPELCFGLPPSRGEDVLVLLVERYNQAGTRSYALRTVRREFTVMADFLFAPATVKGANRIAEASSLFRLGPVSQDYEYKWNRCDGEDYVTGRWFSLTEIPGSGVTRRGPSFYKLSASELVDMSTQAFTEAARAAFEDRTA